MNVDEIVAIFSAALQAIRLWSDVRDRRKTAKTLSIAFQRTKRAKLAEVQGDKLRRLLPEPVLDALEIRVEQCWTAFLSVITDESSTQATLDAAVTELQECLCRETSLIIRLAGKLPAGKLRDWRKAYCGAN